MVERERVAARLLDELDRTYRAGEAGWPELRVEAEARSVFQGKGVRLQGEGALHEGVFAGLGDCGELILEVEGGARRVFGGAEEVQRME